MSTYQPGTVAIVRHYARDCRAFRTGTPSNMGWELIKGDGSKTWVSDSSYSITDIRPLVVLDPADWPRQWNDDVRGVPSLKHWASLADDSGKTAIGHTLRYLADQIEAQTKPPRIPEPGPWGVVEASLARHPQRFHFVRTKFGWTNAGDGKGETLRDYAWESLIDPVLIREGVES